MFQVPASGTWEQLSWDSGSGSSTGHSQAVGWSTAVQGPAGITRSTSPFSHRVASSFRALPSAVCCLETWGHSSFSSGF